MKREIFHNAYFSIYDDDNKVSISAHKSRAVIIPITADEKFILIRNFRNLVEKYSLEFPRGFIEKNEESIDGAKRELKEEIGGYSDNFQFLGSSTVNNGLSTETVDYYVSWNTNLDFYILNREENILDTTTYTYEELLNLISKNRIDDSFTLAGLMKYVSLQT